MANRTIKVTVEHIVPERRIMVFPVQYKEPERRTMVFKVQHTVPERRTIVLPVRMGEVIYFAPEHVIAALTKKLDGSGRS